MKREQIVKRLEDMLLSGKDPYEIVEDVADFIDRGFTPKKDKSQSERWLHDTEQWIMNWIELFPIGVKGGTKLLRSDKKICLTKMAKFRQDYPEFDVDDIMIATQQYLRQQEENDYQYTMPAVNFIQHRDKGSELASRCGQIKLRKNINSESSVKMRKEAEFFI